MALSHLWSLFVKHWVPFTKWCFVPSLVEIGTVILKEKILKISSMYFCFFIIISLWKRGWPFFLNKFKFASPKDALCLVYIKLSKLSMYFDYFIMISTSKRAWPIIWTKLNPNLLRMLCVWFKLAQWFWRRKFLNFVNQCIFCYFVINSPWKRGPFIWTDLNPNQPRMLWAKFGWKPSGCREDENVKSLKTDRRKDERTDRWKDDRRQAIRKAHLS